MSDLLKTTKSVCPVCLARIDAAYVHEDGRVGLCKRCEAHGEFKTPVWEGAQSFVQWLKESPNQPPAHCERPVQDGCPYDCGLCEAHAQQSCCVLLEVTARCNLRCPVCYASAGETLGEQGAASDPPLRTIEGWYDALMADGGPFNVQLSGGEPTLRDDLPDIIRAGRQRGFTFFQLNTNGLRIAHDAAYLRDLAAAGLSTVFLQFDSLRDAVYLRLRGKELLKEKRRAIEACAQAGVGVVLVPTVAADCNLEEMGDIVAFAAANMPQVRGVHFQPISYFGRYDAMGRQGRVTMRALLEELERQTGGRVRASDFSPGGAEHALCTFYANYTVSGDDWTAQGGGGGCCAGEDVRTSDRARDAVAQKWSVPEQTPASGGYDVRALDEFLQRRQTQTLALSGMLFQDAWTLDLQRLNRCHVHVMAPSGRRIPFCACNLTAADGRALHRKG